MHRAERVDLMRELGDAHVGEFRRAAGGDVRGCVGDAEQRQARARASTQARSQAASSMTNPATATARWTA